MGSVVCFSGVRCLVWLACGGFGLFFLFCVKVFLPRLGWGGSVLQRCVFGFTGVVGFVVGVTFWLAGKCGVGRGGRCWQSFF